MSSRNSTVVLPEPVLRRSARLTSLRNGDSEVKPGENLVSVSEPPRKSRRKLGVEVSSKKLVYSLEGTSSKKSKDEFCSLRLSLKGFSDAGKEKPSRVKPTKVSSSCTLRRSPRFKRGEGEESVKLQSSSNGTKSGNIVLSKCSTKSISSKKGEIENGVRSRVSSRSRLRPRTKHMYRDCNDDEEDVSDWLCEGKRMRIANEKACEAKRIEREEEEEEGLKKGWTKEMELALQSAYLTAKPSPSFWKKVSKMVPGKSAQECFDKVNSDLITPRQHQPRSRASKTNLSTIPQFSLSASKLLKPESRKTKMRRKNLSKKGIRRLLEKQNRMDQGVGVDLFSVLEPSSFTSSFLSTPMEKGERLPKILESPRPCSRFATLVSPPVLKQVKNKALHEKYIDHLHIREAKRKAESTRLARKENVRPIENQKKDSARVAEDALFDNVQDAMQKLKSLETENSSSSSGFCYDHDEIDEEDESM